MDYYNKTVFEYTSKDLGLAVGGGGRYDGLVEMLGGKPTPAVGFGLGMDRIILLLKEYGLCDNLNNAIDIYFAILDEKAYNKVSNIISFIKNHSFLLQLDNITILFLYQEKT